MTVHPKMFDKPKKTEVDNTNSKIEAAFGQDDTPWEEGPLKQILLDYVGEKHQPKDGDITVEMIIDNEGFKVNTNKTRIMRSPSRQTVTGLLVNNEVRLSKKDLRRLRAFLHRCSKKGIEAVSKDIGKDAKSVAKGNIAYVQMVSPSIAEEIFKKNQWINN